MATTNALLRLNLISRHLSNATTTSTTATTPRRPLSTSRSRLQYSFTTACSFRGKPGSPRYIPPSERTTQSNNKSSARLQQGLPDDHPLAIWRDQQLQSQPWGAGHDWFFVESTPNDTTVVLGVADGVGGWEESGVDPSHFSQALMWFARERVRKGTFGREGESNGGKGLKALLEGAFEDVTNEKAIVAGSSTACLVALDGETGKLHAANLGDSSFSILRLVSPSPSSSPEESSLPTPPTTPNNEEPTSSSSSLETIPPKYTLIHSEPSQTHFFNAPLQLSKLPPPQNTSNGNLMDSPLDAATTERDGIQLKEGDVVVVSTDGFGDNVFGEELQQLCGLVHHKCLDEVSESSPTTTTSEGEGGELEKTNNSFNSLLASSIAQTSLNFARLIMPKRDKVTPFEMEARKYGYGKELRGGKTDDVTVLVAVVGRR